MQLADPYAVSLRKGRLKGHTSLIAFLQAVFRVVDPNNNFRLKVKKNNKKNRKKKSESTTENDSEVSG